MVKSDDIGHVAKIDSQLHSALVALCKYDALSHVRNGEENSGLDAWRKLCTAYVPVDPQSNLKLLQSVLHPTRCQKVEHLMSGIELGENVQRMYSKTWRRTVARSLEIKLENDLPTYSKRPFKLAYDALADMKRPGQKMKLASTRSQNREETRRVLTDSTSIRSAEENMASSRIGRS